jgi:cysteine desulfurase/selenocysteine lyase
VLQQLVHGAPLAYLDNGATTQMPLAVLDAMRQFETHDRANIHRGVHTLSQRATDDFEAARATLKRFIGAGPSTSWCSPPAPPKRSTWWPKACGWAAQSLAARRRRDHRQRPGAPRQPDSLAARRRRHRRQAAGAAPDAQGRLHGRPGAPAGPRTRVFAVTAGANATGERPPYAEMLRMAAQAGALTVLDAAQAVSHAVPVLAQLDCDFMAFSGHKMYGPMGTGVLAGRRAALNRLHPLRLGGDMVEWVKYDSAGYAELPARLEGGTPNVGGAVGLAAAARFIDQVGRAAIDAHVHGLRAQAVAAWRPSTA